MCVRARVRVYVCVCVCVCVRACACVRRQCFLKHFSFPDIDTDLILAVQSRSLSLPTIQLSRRALQMGMMIPEFLESTKAQARHSIYVCYGI